MSPRSWLEPLYSSDEMRALDRWAIEHEGVPSLELMERAGGEVARAIIAVDSDGPVRVVCGRGNNGGDGLVVAGLLRDHGLDVEALLLFAPDDLSADALRQPHPRDSTRERGRGYSTVTVFARLRGRSTGRLRRRAIL